MESFATLIKNRRSIRKFTGQLLNPDQVEMILKAALMAPASKRKIPGNLLLWRIRKCWSSCRHANRQGLPF